MALRRLDIVIFIIMDIAVIHEDCAFRAIGILFPPVPDRRSVQGQQHTLMNIERPAVIARQPSHIGRISDDQKLDSLFLHGVARLGHPVRILIKAKGQIHNTVPCKKYDFS